MESRLEIRTKSREAESVKEEGEREVLEPVSPIGQYFGSSVLNLSILGVLEFDAPIDNSFPTIPFLQDAFLPINSRFSSIMVVDKKGAKQWKRVDVRLEDHVNVPIFPDGHESYDNYFDDYLTKIAMEPLPHDKPLWQIHIIKYPTNNAVASLIFKLHHTLGDGYSLMGALLSCLQRADNPALPLTFPSRHQRSAFERDTENIISNFARKVNVAWNSLWDFGCIILKSILIEDDKTPIRSGNEFHHVQISTITFSLDQIKQIKDEIGVTVNDVITGIIFLGARLYMLEKDMKLENSRSTLLVMLNTRNVSGYKSVNEMMTEGTKAPWGNHIAFLQVSVPKPSNNESFDPLEFVLSAHKSIKAKRNSLALPLIGQMLETIRKYRGFEAAAKFIRKAVRNSSIGLSNIIGPVEQMALANQPVKGLYFMVVGAPYAPQSIAITALSYMQNLRIAVGVEKGFLDLQKFKMCLENAFQLILEAASKSVVTDHI
ncbi:hypothetical protein Ancab_006019 [Ancistrocladus abbreviatus]